jgi:hypothetical protein
LVSGGGLPTHCAGCGAKLLNPHALQPICLECRYCERQARLAAVEAELQEQRRRQAVADRRGRVGRPGMTADSRRPSALVAAARRTTGQATNDAHQAQNACPGGNPPT